MEFLDSNQAALQALKLFLTFGLLILKFLFIAVKKMKET